MHAKKYRRPMLGALALVGSLTVGCGSNSAGDDTEQDAAVELPDGSAPATDAGGGIDAGTAADAAPSAPDADVSADAGISVVCSGCHGDTDSPAPPEDLYGGTDTALIGVGAHREHLAASTWHRAVVCADCHIVPDSVLAAGHIDTARPAELTFSALADAGAASWNGTTCAGVYCHGATIAGGEHTAPVWTTVNGSQKQCTSCHGAPPPSHDPSSTDCGGCHPTMQIGTGVFLLPDRHIDGVLDADGGGSCLGCHDSAIGSRRQIVGAGGDFERASHHVAGAVEASDCEVCHDQAEHRGGTVRVKNVDEPGTIITLTGDPESVAAEARKLEAFCLACHDADGAGGSPPFSDGVMPPVIDGAAWTASSHEGATLTCAGDGTSFGCHANAHASKKRKLLAPSDASQPPLAGDTLREEEGMCYGCHSASGMASTDVQSKFAAANHHDVSDLDHADGSALECTSCHDPHLARPTARLIDPDTGAAWASPDRTAFCLRCHDGAPPSGVAFVGAASGVSGTGYDKSDYPGSTHDNELGGGASGWGCMHCHDEHGSTHRALLHANYAIADYTSYSASAYALCFTCHTASAVVTGDNAFDDLHDKHVRGEDAPCHLCHDAHREFDAGESGLIDFQVAIDGPYDFSYVSGAASPSAVFYESSATNAGCRLRCHDRGHNPETYNPSRFVTDTTSTAACTACH